MPSATLEYVAAGGNRHPSAADWAPGLLAFGAGHNLALWNPEDDRERGITALLAGHSDTINAVKIFDRPEGRRIITGSADKTVRIWTASSDGTSFEQSQILAKHDGSVNVVAVLPHAHLLVSGAADATIKVWDLSDQDAKPIQSITLKPRYLPLTCALTSLKDGTILMAIAGTSNTVQLYARSSDASEFTLQASLMGHEGWIRSLDFSNTNLDDEGDLLLASASQDKYIRLWRLRKSPGLASDGLTGPLEAATASVKKSLSNKAHQIGSAQNKFNVTFEALLIGHEDWIYTARWAPSSANYSGPTLLSASADNSLAIWQADESSGVWLCSTRLGEISAQKGSTTATGSTGGLWIGLWQPSGEGIVSLGRTGSWRRWTYEPINDLWKQQIGISGHVQEVQGIAWAPDGSYLLSTGSDQTTRLFAEWKRDSKRSWHELARPQIHGYDLNCVGSISPDCFISGADEKLLRVFNKPKIMNELLSTLCGAQSSNNAELPDAANIPVLGLSNKAIAAPSEVETINGMSGIEDGEKETMEPAAVVHKSTLSLDHPPFEEQLARHTLWPEQEKLYGHGYEISTAACSHDGSLVATACKASSIDHAVIRIYECKGWREVKPPLTAHSLTVTCLAFSGDDRYLLSVGRDRGWHVFQRSKDKADKYDLLCSNPKGHSRMILGCSWAPSETGHVFATAGRDKAVKIWKLFDGEANCLQTITANGPVTAVAFDHCQRDDGISLAYGTEDGNIDIVRLGNDGVRIVSDLALDKVMVPSGTINTLCWRPGHSGPAQLAVASDDSSLRILNIGP